ncbi:IPT/TIG domain-containing protein [Actinoplanes sp. NPDC023714]|uniref:beta strand repeat-containing protein n=1 Tax=Actinoplanes sp. NPDC023714 TaxID=3154322 RepID=UPI003407CBB4
MTPSTTPPGSTVTITDADNPLTAGTAVGMIVVGSAQCPSGGYVLGSNTAVTPTRIDDGKVTFPIPGTLVRGTYSLCVYATNASSTNPVLMEADVVLNSAASPTAGPASGTMTLSAPNAFGNATTLGTYFSTSACGGTYSTTNVTPASTTKRDADTATLTVPSGASLNSSAPFARAFNVCTYSSATAGSGTLLTSGTYTVAPTITLTPTSGAAGGGNTLNVTVPTANPIITLATMQYAGFAPSTTGCPTSYTGIDATRQTTITRTTSTTANTAGTTTVPQGVGGPNGTQFAFCLYSSNSGDNLIGSSTVSAYTVQLASSTLNQTTGGGGGSGTVLTLSSNNANAFPVGSSPKAVFVPQATTTAATCPATYSTVAVANSSAAADTRRLTNTKASVSLPASGAAVTKALGPAYSVCVYSSDAITDPYGKLVANATYTVVDVPKLTNVTPVSGPPGGGNTITITGTALPETLTGTTISIGGVNVPNADINLIGATSIAVKAPPHAMGAVNVVLTSTNGTDTLVGGYTYVNSLNVGPNTAPNTGSVSLDIFGTNFKTDYDFASPTELTKSHVYLVSGSYNGGATTVNSATARNNPNVLADCASVLVIDDTELVCTMDLTQTLTVAGTQAAASAARTVTLSGTIAAGTSVITAPTNAAAPFTKADVGKRVAEPGGTFVEIQDGTTILEVVNGTTAVLSKPTNTGTTPAITTVLIGSAHGASGTAVGGTAPGGAITVTAESKGTTLTAATGTFTTADIGRLVTGTNISANTYVVGVNGTGSMITLSKQVGSTAPTAATLTSSSAVPPGAYNIVLVSNAAPGGTTNNTSVSSGSTFTVAPF